MVSQFGHVFFRELCAHSRNARELITYGRDHNHQHSPALAGNNENIDDDVNDDDDATSTSGGRITLATARARRTDLTTHLGSAARW